MRRGLRPQTTSLWPSLCRGTGAQGQARPLLFLPSSHRLPFPGGSSQGPPPARPAPHPLSQPVVQSLTLVTMEVLFALICDYLFTTI